MEVAGGGGELRFEDLKDLKDLRVEFVSAIIKK